MSGWLWVLAASARPPDALPSRYVQIGSVTCREPMDEVSRSVDAAAQAQYLHLGLGAKVSYAQQVQRLDGLSADQKVRERLEFKICMDYGNGLLTKEEYTLWSLVLQGDPDARASLHRLALGEQRTAAHEVPPPTGCAEPAVEESAVVVRAAELLAGGSSGAARPADLEALALLEARTDARSAPFWATLARARLYAAKGPEAVAAAADRALAACPSWGVPDSYRAGALVLANRLGPARDALLAATAKSPDYAFAWYNLGAVELAGGDAGAALTALDRAIARDPSLGEAHWLKGRVLVATGRVAEGAVSLERATALLPDHAEAWAQLGAAWQQQGDARAARALCRAKELGAAVPCPG